MSKKTDSDFRSCAVPQPLRTIALIGKHRSQETVEALIVLARHLIDRGVAVQIEAETAAHVPARDDVPDWIRVSHEEIGAGADVAIVIGGDGTMLGAARRLAHFGVPLVGVNQGRLGFMTDIARSDMLSSMEDLLAGRGPKSAAELILRLAHYLTDKIELLIRFC